MSRRVSREIVRFVRLVADAISLIVRQHEDGSDANTLPRSRSARPATRWPLASRGRGSAVLQANPASISVLTATDRAGRFAGPRTPESGAAAASLTVSVGAFTFRWHA